MLYDRWRQIATKNGGEFALDDVVDGRRLTFGELAAVAENGQPATEPCAFPQGASLDFVLTVLRAWRHGQVVCPLEPGQAAPVRSGEVPPGTVHLKTTSATTATARLVAFTAEQLSSDADNIVRSMGLRPDWPNLGFISLAHSYGFSNLVLPLLLHGIPLILAGAPLPETLRRLASSRPAFTIAAVPALWRTWHEADALPASIRLAISAGAPLPLSLEESVFTRTGLKLHNFYGSTECGGIAFDATEQPRPDASWAGTPLANVDVSISAEGCVQVRSDAVGETYWPEPGPNLQQGLFVTSDLGEIREGKLVLKGRLSDQINVAGRKVLPETIERVLTTHPQVRDCLAFGVPSADLHRGETIVACVAGRGGLTGESLRQFALELLPAWQVPREWWFVDGLEASGRGKLSRAEWRKRYLEQVFARS
jgi:acyl-CoA synthetase (AMP-forming)/AMP-acid ligase II